LQWVVKARVRVMDCRNGKINKKVHARKADGCISSNEI